MIIEVDLNVKEVKLAPIVPVMQGNTGNITLRCHIFSGDEPYIIDSTLYDLVTLSGVTSKGHMISLQAGSVSENTVNFDITENETGTSGDIRLCVEFSGQTNGEKKRLSTYPFILKVTENPSFVATSQEDNVSSLQYYVEQVKKYADSTEEATEIIKNAESAAKESMNKSQEASDNAAAQAKNAKGYAESAEEDAQEIKNKVVDASNYSESASVSAQTSAQKAREAESHALSAAGSSESAKRYEEQAKLISESFSGALRPMGTVVFENLPELSEAVEGDMYNVSNQFTTTSGFKEGEGNEIPAGSNIYKTSDGYWDVLAGSPVTSVNGLRGNVKVTPESIGALPKEEGATMQESIDNLNKNMPQVIKTRYIFKDLLLTADSTYTDYTIDVPIGASEIVVFSMGGNILWFGYNYRISSGYGGFKKIFGEAEITVPWNDSNGAIHFQIDKDCNRMAVINI